MFGRCLQYFGGFGMGGMMFMWIFWIALIILVIYLATRLLNDRSGKVSSDESALDILKKELAKGNITEEEFDRKKKLL
ncbi:MAG: SHOCT domain-containing protein [Trichococcus flocculiformis]|jgi:putative membrane protein|uniref:Membrane protein n=2 Tax=Trichococcus flocculiformis TaxID=82803 RepID=A0A143YW85_9LACT|nr:SHOCT domain-containing protein [Trichococcus sp.]NLD31464.1 SHOCT domain-containing protein [Trichococcus flocculiformis]MBP8683761.1 SHOCT domain-containing protein [Trichococcus sp.]MBP9595060.1 SHOCT domain-containing protein [Trichococcus sp.]MBP9977206.1 SHOCT domain-containing protein [Trichococcus sp.]